MQFKSFEPNIEVNATTVSTIIAGLGYFTNISRRYLSQVGIGQVVNKRLILDMDGWYSQDAWLKAFENIARQIGDRVLFNIGLTSPERADFPPWVTDIVSAIQSIDIAYHLNHRKNGKPLYDLETRVMTEGIGHYGGEPSPLKNEIICLNNNPYPCAFDRGIIYAMATKFQPHARVFHDDSVECRKNGANSCVYHVYW
jgi:hypothetical protein